MCSKKRKDQKDVFMTAVLWLLLTGFIISLICIKESERPKREDFTPVVRTIQQGDTAWKIADEYCPDGLDKRLYLDWCAEANGKPMGYIQAGEHVVFLEIWK